MNIKTFAAPLALLITFVISPVTGQVFDTVINVPADQASIGDFGDPSGNGTSLFQINIEDGGVIDEQARVQGSFVRPGSEININGGVVGFRFNASLVDVNIGGGSVADQFSHSGGFQDDPYEVNITGGTVGELFRVSRSVVNISGGTIGRGMSAEESVVNISGGSVGQGPADNRNSIKATSNSVVNISGGTVGPYFSAANCEVNISGGTVEGGFRDTENIVVNLLGGSIENTCYISTGGVLNMSGGTIGEFFAALGGSEINLFGSEFFLDGVHLDTMVPGQPVTINNRNGEVLSGTLNDGSTFSFTLDSTLDFVDDFFADDATVTVAIPFLGDVNVDGSVDFSDIAPFISVLSAGGFNCTADIDRDGVVNFLDIAPFIAMLSGQ